MTLGPGVGELAVAAAIGPMACGLCDRWSDYARSASLPRQDFWVVPIRVSVNGTGPEFRERIMLDTWRAPECPSSCNAYNAGTPRLAQESCGAW